MPSFISILAATDFSVDGNNAMRRAALLTHEHGARLHILHVLNPAGCKPLRDWFSPTLDLDLKAAQARDALRRLAVEILGAYNLTASVEVAVGNPFETLMKASEHVDLVVLGRRGHGHLKGLLVGRTVDRMLRICRRPVLVVKTSVQGSYRWVLVPIDFTAASGAAIRVADRMRREMSMHVFHALNSKREAVMRDADVPEYVIREIRLMEEGAINARMRRKVIHLGRAYMDADHVGDLATPVVTPRAGQPSAAAVAQASYQLLAQLSPWLGVDGRVDGLVRHVAFGFVGEHALGKRPANPS